MSPNRFAISRLVVAPLLALGLLGGAASAQTRVAPMPRILAPVNTSQMVALKGSVHPLAQPRYDRGLLPDAMPTGHMMLVLRRSEAQETALRQLIAAQQDPKSPSYHKWLTPESFGAQFGVADADVQAVTSYLSSQGFTVGRVFKNKMAVEFSGTVGQVRSSFQTEIHTYSVNGQTFHANASEPKVPAALSPVVGGFAALNNYKTPRPVTAQKMVLDRKTGTAHPLFADQNNQVESVSPGDLAVIYDIPTSTYTGAGVTVGIVNDSNINLAIPANYRTTFGLPAVTPTVIVDGVDPGIISDADLGYEQVELVSAVAPQANINYYLAGTTDVDNGFDFATIRAVEDNAVQVLVFGFESCEQALGLAGNLIITTAWEQAAAQGISVVVDSGSGGAASCDAPVNGNVQSQATHGLAVNGYASTPYNTAVGATDFYYGITGAIDPTNLGGFLQYWNTSNSGTAGYTSAKSYIPEQPANSSYQATNQVTFPPFVLATGGGVSTLGQVTQTGPTTFVQSPHPQPSYQASVASSISTTARVVPDVSFFGGALTNGSTYIFCVDAADCVNGTPDTLVYTAGGNSTASTAVFGGIAALLIQAKGAQGNLNPILYATYGSTPSAFHDVANGTNAVNCQSGSPNCGANGYTTTGTGLAYTAGAGYDAASGLGSLDVAKLISAWKNPSGTATVSMSITDPTTNQPIYYALHHGDPVRLNVSVAGSSGTPTGDVSITTTSPQPASVGVEVLTLTNGQAVDGYLNLLPGGSYNLVARYAGDGTYAPAVASLPITIYTVTPRLDVLSQNFTNATALPYGTMVQVTFEVFNANNANDVGTPTGSINLTDNGQQVAVLPINSEGVATFQSAKLAAGAHNFSASYAGDNSFGYTTLVGAAPSFTIAGTPTATTLTATASSMQSRNNGSIQLIATVTSTTAGTAGTAPRGAVNFDTTTGTKLGTVTLDLGSNTGTNPAATAALKLNRTQLPVGVSTTAIIATYVHDSSGDYAASASAPVTISSFFGRNLVTTRTTLSTTPTGAVNFLDTGSLSFNVTVVQLAGTVVPTGSVTFYSNGTSLGTSNLDASGAASITIPQDQNTGYLMLPLGQSVIAAEYSGDSGHANSSAAYTVNVYGEPSTPDFSMQTGQIFQTISPSNTTANFTLQFGALNGFEATNTAITLTTTAPAGITCKKPASPNFAGGLYTTVTLTCGPSAGVTVGQLNAPVAPHLFWVAEGGAALACIFLFGMPARRRSWQSMVGGLAIIVVAFGMTGCGADTSKLPFVHNPPSGSSSSAVGPNAVNVLAPGRYTILVTATAPVFSNAQANTTINVVHTLPLTLVVQ